MRVEGLRVEENFVYQITFGVHIGVYRVLGLVLLRWSTHDVKFDIVSYSFRTGAFVFNVCNSRPQNGSHLKTSKSWQYASRVLSNPYTYLAEPPSSVFLGLTLGFRSSLHGHAEAKASEPDFLFSVQEDRIFRASRHLTLCTY